jgi:hypothetical protein
MASQYPPPEKRLGGALAISRRREKILDFTAIGDVLMNSRGSIINSELCTRL